MRKIRKHITTIILAVLAVIAGVYAYNYHDMKQNIVYNEHLGDVAGAVLDNADITDYDFSGGRYKKLLEKNNYKIKEKVWKRVDMGNVTLDH